MTTVATNAKIEVFYIGRDVDDDDDFEPRSEENSEVEGASGEDED